MTNEAAAAQVAALVGKPVVLVRQREGCKRETFTGQFNGRGYTLGKSQRFEFHLKRGAIYADAKDSIQEAIDSLGTAGE